MVTEVFAPSRECLMSLNSTFAIMCDVLEAQYGSRYDARISMIMGTCRHLMNAIAELDRALS